MCGLTHIIVATLCLTVANCIVYQSGRCDNRTLPVVNITVEQLTSPKIWNAVYATHTTAWDQIDHVSLSFHKNCSGHYILAVNLVANGTPRLAYECAISSRNNYFYVDCHDADGNAFILHYYVLYFKEGQVIYAYRCTETDVPGTYLDTDVRFVAVTTQHQLTSEELQTIFAIDSSNFEGELRNYELQWP